MPLNSDQLVALAHSVGGVQFKCTCQRAKVYCELRDRGLIELDIIAPGSPDDKNHTRVLLWAECTNAGLSALNYSRAMRQQRLERDQFHSLRRKFAYELDFVSLEYTKALLARAFDNGGT